jgi:hypothetical protein
MHIFVQKRTLQPRPYGVSVQWGATEPKGKDRITRRPANRTLITILSNITFDCQAPQAERTSVIAAFPPYEAKVRWGHSSHSFVCHKLDHESSSTNGKANGN